MLSATVQFQKHYCSGSGILVIWGYWGSGQDLARTRHTKIDQCCNKEWKQNSTNAGYIMQKIYLILHSKLLLLVLIIMATVMFLLWLSYLIQSAWIKSNQENQIANLILGIMQCTKHKTKSSLATLFLLPTMLCMHFRHYFLQLDWSAILMGTLNVSL